MTLQEIALLGWEVRFLPNDHNTFDLLIKKPSTQSIGTYDRRTYSIKALDQDLSQWLKDAVDRILAHEKQHMADYERREREREAGPLAEAGTESAAT